MEIVLASGSPRRAKILRSLGVCFEIVKTDAREVCYGNDPERTVTENAIAKGAAVTDDIAAGRPVLSADTIVWFNGKIYGKPRDLDEARMFLRELSAQTHTVFTGIAFCNAGITRTAVVKSDVTFRALSEAEIDDYVARVQPTDRAGAYDIDESGDRIVASHQGSYENIMGLPIEPTKTWIQEGREVQ